MTQFEKALQQAREGKLQTPVVSMGDKTIPYFGFQLLNHIHNLKIMALGMTVKGMKLSDLKSYYGLKGRSAKDCLPQLEQILADYKAELNTPNNG